MKKFESDEFDYESLWEQIAKDREREEAYEAEQEPRHSILGPQPLPKAHKDSFILSMDDDEHQAYNEFLRTTVETLDYKLLHGIGQEQKELLRWLQ